MASRDTYPMASSMPRVLFVGFMRYAGQMKDRGRVMRNVASWLVAVPAAGRLPPDVGGCTRPETAPCQHFPNVPAWMETSHCGASRERPEVKRRMAGGVQLA